MKISGIYKIQSVVHPERIYIGSAVSVNNRWNCHLCNLKLKKHSNKKLQNHYNKYGESDLQFSLLLGCDKKDLIKNEQYFIDSYNPYFNICKKAESRLGVRGQIPWNKGKKRLQIPWNKGKKTGLIPWNKDKKMTPEYCKIASESHKGIHPSKEQSEKQSKSLLKYYQFHPSWMTGKKDSLETRKKKSEKALGNKRCVGTRNHCKKVIDNNTGIIYECALDAAKIAGIHKGSFVNMLNPNNHHKNKTTFSYLSKAS
jgi:group I intron endonuclease